MDAGWHLTSDASEPFTFEWHNVVGLLATFAVSALANSAGVGGGAFFVPLFNLVVGFVQLLLSFLLTAACIVHVFPKEKRPSLAVAEEGPGVDTAPLLTPSSPVARADRVGFTRSGIAQVAVITAGIGLVAGVVGLGGGMMIGPLLLSLGVHPQVVSATSNMLVFISSSSAALSFAAGGHLVTQYALVFSLVAVAGSTTGLVLLRRLVARSGRTSIVVLILAFIMLAGGILMGVFEGVQAWEDVEKHTPASQFSRLCPRTG